VIYSIFKSYARPSKYTSRACAAILVWPDATGVLLHAIRV